MKVHTIAEYCEGLGLPISMVPEVVEAFERRELVEIARHEARMQRSAGRPDNVALPLTDQGHEFGRVEARIPRTLFFNLAMRKSFGMDGLMSDDGMKDLLRDNPQCRVETVSGRIVSGYSGPPRTVVKKYG